MKIGLGSDYMTNEEWLNGLDTEDKAIVLAHICMKVISDYEDNKCNDMMYISYWEPWLKAEHKE